MLSSWMPTAGVGLVLGLLGCASQPVRGDPRDTLTALVAADNRSDLDAALACYTDDVVWLPPVGGPVTGKAGIAARYRAMFERDAPDLTADIDESRANGDLAFVRGTMHGMLVPRGGGAALKVRDSFLMLLRGSATTWKISHLMWHPVAPDAAR